MKLTDLNEAAGSTPKQKAAQRILKDFDKSMFNGFKMVKDNGSLTKAIKSLFKEPKGFAQGDLERSLGILNDIDTALRAMKNDIKTLSDIIKFGNPSDEA